MPYGLFCPEASVTSEPPSALGPPLPEPLPLELLPEPLPDPLDPEPPPDEEPPVPPSAGAPPLELEEQAPSAAAAATSTLNRVRSKVPTSTQF